MDLPVMPPVAPMLAKSVKDIPVGALSYEPKWDGFRSVVFRDGAEVEIGSRNERPMTRYFPEVVEALLASLPERCVVDGEIVIPASDGRRLDFEALLQRIHPADSRVRLLAKQTPASFVAFDLLALGDVDYTSQPFEHRRAMLEEALADAAAPVYVTPTTRDRDTAVQWFSQFEGAGLDGVVAKPLKGSYQPDKRVMFKIKHERTADCVVAGYRVHKSGPDAIGSLLLGLYDAAGNLASVGVVGAFPMAQRRQLFAEVQPLVTSFAGHPWNWGGQPAPGLGGPPVQGDSDAEAVAEASEAVPAAPRARHPREAEGSRWNAGKDLSFVPLRPERVVEVRYEHMEGTRFRHTAQWVRWRPDRDPRSCGFDQLEEPVRYNLAEVLTAGRD
jgi:ATP-dependent DNA ligase